MKRMTGMSSVNKPILTDIKPVFANGLNDIFSRFDPAYNPEIYADLLKTQHAQGKIGLSLLWIKSEKNPTTNQRKALGQKNR